MNNKCLPPDDFEKLVMNKIENVDIDKKLSPFALAFLIFGCISSLIMALATEKMYITELLKNWGLYGFIGKYYNAVLNLENRFFEYWDHDLILALFCVALGIYFVVYSLTFGVRKNG